MKNMFFVIYTVIRVNDICGERKTKEHGMPKVIASPPWSVVKRRANARTFMQRGIT